MKWFNLLKRWSKWRKLCRKFDYELTVLFDKLESERWEANDD